MDANPDPWLLAFDVQLSPKEIQLLSEMDGPAKIQAFLNTIPYSEDEFSRCPLRLLRDHQGHCFDGALFAALALRRLGRPPMLLELVPNERDDDHLLAIFRDYGGWGAIAQSNFTGLRYREPVYRSLRELVMSYFDDHLNVAGERTLRGYRGPFLMKLFDNLEWMVSDAGLEKLAERMDQFQVHALLSDEMVANLSIADQRSVAAALLGANPRGLYKIPD
jgi:hypothetical protein